MAASAAQITSLDQLTRPQRRALEGLDILHDYTGTVDMITLRANGHRRDVIDRLCAMELAYAAGDYLDPDRIRFAINKRGSELLDAAAEAEAENLQATGSAEIGG